MCFCALHLCRGVQYLKADNGSALRDLSANTALLAGVVPKILVLAKTPEVGGSSLARPLHFDGECECESCLPRAVVQRKW